MADPRLVARALAEAFLAGDWSAADLADRGAVVLGERPAWLVRLARRLCRGAALALDALTAAARRALKANSPGAKTIRAWVLEAPVFGAHGAPFDVPPLATTDELARFLDLTPGQLLAFADLEGRSRRARTEARTQYRSHWVARPGAAPRLLEAPKPLLAAAQRRVLRAILDRVPAHPAAHGFVRGRSALTFATPHAGKAAVLRLDLEGFFGSISGALVTAIFEALGYPREIARLLAGITTTRATARVIASAPRADLAMAIAPRFRALRRAEAPHLPQGAPTSPAIANLAAFGIDARLSGAARAAGVTYTRYADDLAFSGDATFSRAAPAWIDLVARVVAEEGFLLHARKTRLTRQGARQKLAGLVVNAAPAVSRRDRDRLEAILHGAATRGPEGENREGHPDFRAHLRGRIAWVAAANPRHGEKLLRLFAAVRWPEE